MEISKTAILDKTHYGLNIYSHVLRHYYPGEIASGDSLTPSENKNDRQQTVLSLSGRDCQPTKNPFNDNKPTLKIQIVNNCAEHDLENSISKGKWSRCYAENILLPCKASRYNIAVTPQYTEQEKYSYQLSLNLSILSFLSFCKRLSRLLHSMKKETFFVRHYRFTQCLFSKAIRYL